MLPALATAAELRVVDGLPPLQEPNVTALVQLLDRVDPPADRPLGAADWASILADPAAVRGGLFRVDGRYAGRQRAAEARGVPLTEWGVIATDAAGADLPLVVYLPRRNARPPAAGAEVTGTARFLALWTDADAAGAPRSYPVLVSRNLAAVAVPPSPSAGRAAWIPRLAALALLLAAAAWLLGRRGPKAPRREKLHRPRQANPGADLPEAASDLPADPADALARLAEVGDRPDDT